MQSIWPVCVSVCRNLISFTDSGSDPYVRLYLLPDKRRSGRRKTHTIKKNLNPVYDQTLDSFFSHLHPLFCSLSSFVLWFTNQFWNLGCFYICVSVYLCRFEFSVSLVELHRRTLDVAVKNGGGLLSKHKGLLGKVREKITDTATWLLQVFIGLSFFVSWKIAGNLKT